MKKHMLILAFLMSFFGNSHKLHAEASLSKYQDKTIGYFSDLASIVPWYYPTLFSHTPEEILFTLSYLKAKRVFWNSYQKVPAYKTFVKSKQKGLPQKFSEVPIMSKENYIKKYHVRDTLLYGKYPKKGQIDTSTGTSGKPTKWIRGNEEMEHVKHWIEVASRTAVGNKPYIFCNMFALGPWATGMTSSYALTGTQLILSIGPNLEMLYDTLRELGPKRRYVIAGYPPHMKKLVDNAPFDLKEYNITIIVGGEAMSENVYEHIKAAGIKDVYSSYGASDLRINIAQQTEFEQRLQKICRANPAFKKALLGTLHGTPNFFHYNPLLDYIEETEDGRLLFTDLDIDRISPRVRYDLGDKGKVLKVSFVQDLLKQFGYKMSADTNLPLICLYGRGEDALTFNGCNLMYDDLDRALKLVGIYDQVNRYAFNKFENEKLDQVLELWIELKADCKKAMLQSVDLEETLIQALAQVNQDFKAQLSYIRTNTQAQLPEPRVFIFDNGTSPMIQQGPHHKNKYVYSMKR